MTLEILVVFAIVAVAIGLFVNERIPIDLTAIGILVGLIFLGPWTNLSVQDALMGFASPATITVLAMFVLSEGVRRTGLISVVGKWIATNWGDSFYKQLAAVLGLSGSTAGFVNNTPVVAVMIPLVDELSERTGVSPSKLLMPISFAAMMGGTLTLIGTSTNLLASDLYDQMGEQFGPFTIFEFTGLGIMVLIVGVLYLLVVGHRLIPERIRASDQLTEDFNMMGYLTEVVVEEGSGFIGQSVQTALSNLEVDADIIQLIRDNQVFTEPLASKRIRAGDVLLLRTDRGSLVKLIETQGLGLAPEKDGTAQESLSNDPEYREEPEQQELFEVVVTPDSFISGSTLAEVNFRSRYNASVLAIRRGDEVIHERLDEQPLRGGDALLIQGPENTAKRFTQNRNFVVGGQFYLPAYRQEKIWIALGIVGLVVVLAGVGVAGIVELSLAGMLAMVATGCLRPREVYEAVDWNVIFLLAGLIPLGTAMVRTGAAEFLAENVFYLVGNYPPVILLGIIYLLTVFLTNIMSNNASVVLMLPIAVDIAVTTGLNPFAFALAVTFAASTAFMTPMGYQTNLMVYGPGGYRFSDFMIAGAPLQVLMTVVTVLGISWIWGIG